MAIRPRCCIVTVKSLTIGNTPQHLASTLARLRNRMRFGILDQVALHIVEKAEIAAEIRSFIAQESQISDPALLGDNVDLFADGILSSLMAVSLVAFCQQRFGCDLGSQEFSEDDMRTISALANLVATTKAGGV